MQLATNAAAMSSSSPARQWKYEVFLSFRGQDTRQSFVSHMYTALHNKGILTFKDDKRLEHGKSISTALLKAIEESRLALVILSPNYANSSWCLNELVKIMQCRKDMGQEVVPIFHNVDPSEVRHQTGRFLLAVRNVTEHEEVYSEDRNNINRWRAALREVAGLKGWDLQHWVEAELVESVATWVLNRSLYASSTVDEGLVGMESLIDKILQDHICGWTTDCVRIIGIHGMRGIGKTTVARAVYDQICHHYERSCFLSNVRSETSKNGLVSLQEQLLSKTLVEKIGNIEDEHMGAAMIKKRLAFIKVLLVVDDVDQLAQLEKLAGGRDWFGLGSRIIITSTDEHLLKVHGVDGIYKVTALDHDEALKLLSSKAFKKGDHREDYLSLCSDIVQYAGGLPLAIVVVGSFLCGRSILEWKSAIDRLRNTSDRSIMDVLHISFDGLRETEKEIFLHIACFFKGNDRVRVTEILNYCGLYPEIGLTILSEKSLITFSSNKLEMHGLLQEMGWQIVSRESPTYPGKRSRLWSHEDIHNVLTKNKGTNVVQGIVMELPILEVAHWNPEAFSNLSQLRFLQVHNVHPSQGLTCLPESLRLLEWTGYPLRSLPQYFQPDELIELNLCHSNLDLLWKGIKRFPKLKFIKICHSHHISETPDFTGVQELESLDLEGCKNLVGIHQSLGLLKKLTLLNLKDCESLESLPGKIEMESLETFILSGCLKVKQVPEFGNMQLLSVLKLDETAIETIPESIEHLSGLVTLDLSNCKNLVCLPSTINRLKSLKNLNLSGCLKLGEEQESTSEVECLEKNDDSRTAETEVPNFGVMQKVKKEPVTFWSPSFGLCNLTDLNLSNCKLQEGAFLNGLGVLSSLVALNLSGNNFVSLPSSIRSLVKLESINIENCKRLTELSGLPSNSKLDVRADGCSSLQIFNTSELNVLEKSYFNFLNCFKLNDNQSLLNMTFEMLKKFLHQGNSSAKETFQIAIPGSEIPKWFSHQNDVGSSLTVDLPPLWNKSKFMGYALCAVFVLDEHCVVDEHDTFHFKTFHATHHLVCRLKHSGKQLEVRGTQPAFRFSEKFCQVDSDHLWMFYVSRDKYFGMDWHNSCSQIEFLFETRGPGLKVKKCGVRLMYEQDVQALQSESATVNTSIFPVEEDVINMIDDNVTHTSSDMTLHQREWQLFHSNGFSHSVGINEDITKRASSDSFLQWTQWQLLDSILPTGGFTHSFGLEAAIQARLVSSPEDLQTFIIRLLENTGSLLLPFVYSTTISPDLDTTRKLDKMLDAMLTDEVVRKASISKGMELMRVAAAVYVEIPSVKSTMEAWLSSGGVSFHHAHAFGLICGLLGLDSTTTQRAYMFITMRDVISAATRLNLVGPLGAAVLQHKIASGAAEAILNRWKDRPVEEASQALSLPQI